MLSSLKEEACVARKDQWCQSRIDRYAALLVRLQVLSLDLLLADISVYTVAERVVLIVQQPTLQ